MIAITIAPHGTITFDGAPMTLAEVAAAARTIVAETGDASSVRARITAELGVPHSSVVDVMDALRAAEVTHFALDVRPEDLTAH